MFLVEESVQVPLGRHGDGRKYMQDQLSAMATQPGFKQGHVCAYLGNIRQHLLLSNWADAASYEGWTKSAQAAEQAKTRRPFTIDPYGKFYELLLETPGPETGNFLNQGMLQLLEGKTWDEFMEQRHEHDASALQAGGLVYVRAYKFVGEPNPPYFTPETIAVLVRRKDRAAYEHSVEVGIPVELSRPAAYRSISPQLSDLAGLYDYIYDTPAK